MPILPKYGNLFKSYGAFIITKSIQKALAMAYSWDEPTGILCRFKL
jgi:hypothetical protein